MSDPRVRGVVHLIEETKTFGARGFRKRLVVLEQNTGRFTNFLPMEFTNDACDQVNELNVGDEVEVAYRLTGRRWQKDSASEAKFFLSAEATSFKVLKGTGAAAEDRPPDAFSEDSPPDDSDPPF